MRLLLIEDDENLLRSLGLALKSEGYAVDLAADGERGYFLAGTNSYDLIVLDYNLPDLNGREIIEKLRRDKIDTPMLMLTVRSELDDKIKSLEAGADDYLTKPFALPELLARIKSLVRRPQTWQGRVLTCQNISLDPDKFLVTKNTKAIKLSAKEFSLLEYLLRNKGRIVSRQDIMEHVWDENADPFSNTIEVHIRSLRHKLGDEKHRLIATFSRRGYRIDEIK